MRVSDAMREEVAVLLGRRYAEGYLSAETLERRLERTLRATTRDALDRLVADLPRPGPTLRTRAARLLARPLDLTPYVATGEATLGRSRSCDVVLADDSVSRRHAHLRFAGEHAVLADLDSTNGTWVDGRRIDAARVRSGDVIRLGAAAYRLRF